jgi:dolichyl-diphosphooligosaccharide---protein glycosyltransferase
MTKEIELGEVISNWFRNIANRVRDHFKDYEIDKQRLIHNTSFVLIIVLSLMVRSMTLMKGWDPILKGFDPMVQYRSTQYMIEHGVFGFLQWKDYLSWYPFGREFGPSMYIAVPVAAILIYYLLTFLGFNITLYFAAFITPIIFGTLGVIFMYLLAKELISPRAGLIAALLMAVTPAYLSRSVAGFFDNEAVGVLFSIMTFYFFIKALNNDSIKYAFFSGLSMFLLAASWGAFRFGYDLVGLYVLILLITGNYSERLVRVYSVFLATACSLMILFPRIGGGFLLGLEGLAPVGVLVILILYGSVTNISVNLKPQVYRQYLIVFTTLILAIAISGAFVLAHFGYLSGIGDKFISVINPSDRKRLPLIDSVSEHQPLSWGSFYYNMSTMVFFIPFGLYYCLKKPTERNLFILVLGLTSIYFSGSMIRLMLILAPAAVILTALAIDNLLSPYALIAHKRIKLSKTKLAADKLGGPQVFLNYMLVGFLMFMIIYAGINAADQRMSSPELTPGSTPSDSYSDWPQTFDFMRTHTSFKPFLDDPNRVLDDGGPPVMLSWWDYGYYITALGDTVSLVDNATTNSTQIATVGTMLMWNSTASINLMYKYNVNYVLVYSASGLLQLGSDIGKSVWMIRIAEQYTPQFGIVEKDYFDRDEGGYHGKYLDSVLWKLMSYRSPDMTAQGSPFIGSQNWANTIAQNLDGQITTELTYFKEVFRSDGYQQTAASLPGMYPFIRIFEVIYPEDIELRVREFDLKIAQIMADMEEN